MNLEIFKTTDLAKCIVSTYQKCINGNLHKIVISKYDENYIHFSVFNSNDPDFYSFLGPAIYFDIKKNEFISNYIITKKFVNRVNKLYKVELRKYKLNQIKINE
jgi:hypothetical protein